MSSFLKNIKMLTLGFLLSACCGNVFAADSFVVEDIRVEGIERTDAGAVFAKIPSGVGDTIGQGEFTEIVKQLFRTGYFSDVRVSRDGNVLVVSVVERPAIASISFFGTKEFKAEQLEAALASIGLKTGQILDASVFDAAEQQIKEAYIARGKYGIEVSTTVTPLERNRVGLSFDIFEGKTASIRRIAFTGNSYFSEKDILEVMTLAAEGYGSWFSRGSKYSKQDLQGDLESIRSLYLNNGFLYADIESSQVSISPEKEGVYITINIKEGAQYKLGVVSVSGDNVVPHDELYGLLEIPTGDLFSRSVINLMTEKIVDRLGEDGFSNARVNSIPQVDEGAKEVDEAY
jgi:outer membrane protein insertion porin family